MIKCYLQGKQTRELSSHRKCLLYSLTELRLIICGSLLRGVSYRMVSQVSFGSKPLQNTNLSIKPAHRLRWTRDSPFFSQQQLPSGGNSSQILKLYSWEFSLWKSITSDHAFSPQVTEQWRRKACVRVTYCGSWVNRMARRNQSTAVFYGGDHALHTA